MLRWIGRAVVAIFAVIGLLTVLLVTGLVWQIGEIFEAPPPTVPDPIVLELDLRQPLAEGPPAAGFAPVQPRPTTVREVVSAIDLAAADDRVAALRANIGAGAFGLATAQELRDAVARFRESGKPAIAYAESYGSFGDGTPSYYLASGFEEVWLRPIGSVGATGIFVEMPFANALLTDLGVDPDFVREGAYKTTPEMFTETGFSEANREMMESLTDSLFAQVVAGIAEGRGLGQAEVRSLIDRAPLLAEEAEAAGLVDRLGSGAALEADLAERFGDDAGGLGVRDYLRTAPSPSAETRIGLVYGVGTIVLEDGSGVPGLGQQLMGAYRVAGAIDDAAEDDDVDAIVLRIDSGGGSAIASAVIEEAVRRAGSAGKPVIVSMAGAAASGGYWISAPAAEIVAQPATLTGSIGVFAGTFGSRELWQEIGVNWESVQRGANADLASTVGGFSPAGREEVEAFVSALYERFVALVAEGRGLDPAAVREIAQGRVWTGAQAAERGLVDRLGGLDVAFAAARQSLDVPADAPLEIVVLPEAPSPLEQLRRLLSVPVGEAAMAAALDRLHPAIRDLARRGDGTEDQWLRMPPLAVRP